MDIKKLHYLILCSLAAVSLTIILGPETGSISSKAYAQNSNASSLSVPLNLQGQESNNTSDLGKNIGQPFYVENTKSTNMRVLNVDNLPSVEVTYAGNSKIDGSPTQTIGTVVDKMGTEGAVHSKGQAIILTETGQVITYKSESIGHYNPDGSFSDSGIIQFDLPFVGSNNSKATLQNELGDNSYLEFNNALGIYKKTVDPLGNGVTKVWKWG